MSPLDDSRHTYFPGSQLSTRPDPIRTQLTLNSRSNMIKEKILLPPAKLLIFYSRIGLKLKTYFKQWTRLSQF